MEGRVGMSNIIQMVVSAILFILLMNLRDGLLEAMREEFFIPLMEVIIGMSKVMRWMAFGILYIL